jgi:hypothetical protein
MSEEIKDIAEEVIVEETNEVVEAVETVETTIEAPLTEARTISAINASLSEMNKAELDAIFEAAEKAKAKAKVEADHEDDEEDDEEGDDEEGEVENEKKEGKAKKESKKAVQKEETFKEDLDALVGAEEALSEGFKEKDGTIFEAALQSKVAAKTVELEERYASDLTEEVEAIKEDLVDKVDGYLTYVVENWMKDNEVAIEHSLKSEITESFIQSLGQLFAEHHINVPDDAGDILDSLSEEAKDAKSQLNDATERNIELSEKVKSYQRQDIIREACKGLAATEAAKLTELTEAIEADDNDGFATKVATIKESYLNKDTAVETLTEVDGISEDSQEKQVVSDQMQKYLDAISRT